MRKRPIAGVCLCLIFFICFIRLTGLPVFWASGQDSGLYDSISQGGEGIVYGQIYRREQTDEGSTLYLKNTILVIQSNQYSLQNSKISFDFQPEIKTGYSVCVSGYVYLPETARNPGQFDAQEYYSLRHVSLLMKGESCTVTKKDVSLLQEAAARLKTAFAASLERGMDNTHAGTMMAILLGDKGAMEDSVTQLYRQGGISHILAISALHISILGMGIYRLLRKRFGICSCAAVSGGFLFFYLVLIGFPVSAQRAVYMFWMQMGARVTGRRYDRPTSLALAAIVILLQNPLYLFDSGFLLSFAAACFLMLVEENSGAVKTGIWLWFGLLPLTAWFFYEITPVSMLLNLLVIPLFSLVLFLGLCGGIAGMFSALAGRILLFLPGCILQLYSRICEIAEKLPFGRIIVGRPSFWQMAAAYGIAAVYLYFTGKRKGERELYVKRSKPSERFLAYLQEKKGKKAKVRIGGRKQTVWKDVLRAAVAAGSMLFLICVRIPENVQITMLDVGQGDCGVITSRGAGAILVDGGSSSENQVGEYRILPYLKYRGIRHISCMILTHPDEDHMNGLLELLVMKKEGALGIQIDRILVPAWMENSEAGAEFLQEAGAAGIPVSFVRRGDRLQNGELTLHFLHPDGEEYGEDTNAGSLTFLLKYNSFTELFTGDLEGSGEEAVLQQQPECDVLKVAHHGSRNSTSPEWLSGVKPSLALISCGENNRYGHPHEEVLQRLNSAGVSFFVTRDCGALTLHIKRDGTYTLYPWLQAGNAAGSKSFR